MIATKRNLVIDFIRNNKRVTSASAVYGFLSNVCTVLIPLFLAKFYQLALRTHSARGTVFDKMFGRLEDIEMYFIYFGALILLKFVFDYFQNYYSGLSKERFAKSLREELFNRQLKTKLSVFEGRDTGKYLLRYSGDLSAIQRYLEKGILAFIKDCVFMILAITILFIIEVQLAWFVIVLFPVIFLLVLLVNRQLKRYTRKRRNTRSENLAFVSSRLHSMMTIKLFNREDVEAEKFEKRSEQLYGYGKKYYRWYALLNGLVPFLLYMMLMAILIYAYDVNHRGEKGIPGNDILVFILQVVNFMPAMRRLLGVNVIWQAGDVSIRKLLNVMNAEEELRQKDAEEKMESGKIEFVNVEFGFTEDKPFFKNLSFTVNNMSLSLLRGEHGSGKSTVFKLISGLYDYSGGQVLVDDKEVKPMSKYLLRKSIAIISDELPLIGNTVFEAVSYSRKEEKRQAAAEMLYALQFTERGDEAVLDFPLTEGGKNLSAGQRKLLKIARALLTRKKIILMDEPFVDLDGIHKEKLIEIINKLKSKRTIIVIDRTGEALHYDQVIQLEAPPIELVLP